MNNYKDYFKITTTQNECEHSVKGVKLEVQQIKPFDFSPINIDNVDSVLNSINKQVYEKIGIAEDSMILREALLKAQMYDAISNQLGCHLEVVFKAIMKGCYILKDSGELERLTFQDIYIRFEDFWDYDQQEIIDYSLCIGSSYDYSKLEDYKVTWWLKADRSE